MKTSEEIATILIKEKITTHRELEEVKRRVAKKYKTSFPTNISILSDYRKMGGGDFKVLSLLRTRPVRSLSGVVNISVLTKPSDCPGECIYCPSQEGTPKSYLKSEPAVMRAILNNYHPAKQIQMRLRALSDAGHPTDKIEVRTVGSTWSYYPEDYREWFIKECFDACNESASNSLDEAQQKNEQSRHRIVCLSVETRPDYINKKEITHLRKLGVTMVELGVQTLSDRVLSLTKRGHGIKETAEATKLLRNAGFKICYQVMPNLPYNTTSDDLTVFKEMFSSPLYRPDFLKIYPCLVIENTALYKMWQRGEFKPFSDEELLNLLAQIKKDIIPRYTRIQRVFRDVPVPDIRGGCKISNLREKLTEHSKNNNWQCQCIRCREVKGEYSQDEEVLLFREDYSASGGNEVFLTLENKDRSKLYALLRLRLTKEWTLSSLSNAALIREIRTYGQQIPLKQQGFSPQHRGMGKWLVKEAERVAREEFNYGKISVISGVGVRDYWRRQGYELEDNYMTKKL